MSRLRNVVDRIKGAATLSGRLRDRLASPDARALRWAVQCADMAAAVDCRRLSDADLRAELRAATERPGALLSPARALALASVAMERRLGAWRVFGHGQVPHSLRKCLDLAGEIIESATHVDRVRRSTDSDFASSETLQSHAEATLDRLRLSPDEREVARGAVYANERLQRVEPADTLLPASFYCAVAALDQESALRFAPTREQVISAALLLRGTIVEMDAGEGKTIAAGLAAIVAAAAGRSVHVVTANDYLALRDTEWLSPVYQSLGISVDVVLSAMEDDERRLSYAHKVVYATAREIGFDHLRDNLRLPPDQPVQCPLDTAIVDEADHVLIDQDQTPLIISGEETEGIGAFQSTLRAVQQLLALHGEQVRVAESNILSANSNEDGIAEDLAMLYSADPESTVLREAAATHGIDRNRLTATLDEMHDEPGSRAYEQRFYYVTDAMRSSVRFTQRGEELIAQQLGQPDGPSSHPRDDPWTGPDMADLAPADLNGGASDETRWEATLGMAHQLLRAYTLFRRNVDYVVTDGRVVIVDPVNGRLLPDNRYLHGLQAALEAKEGLDPRPEMETIAQITISGLMSKYTRVSGLTGTAVEARDEFDRGYGLGTVKVPPTHPPRRVDHVPSVFPTTAQQQAALLEEVRRWRSIGRPVLVGTVSVRQSEEISDLLEGAGIEHSLLNAVTSEREAQIVRDAGRFEAVTVATNMAGRGTDVVLEPGLDRRIVTACLDRVSGILADRPSAMVELRCGTRAEADLIAEAAMRHDATLCRVADSSAPSSTCVVVTRGGATPGKDLISVEFGLGLCVVGVALHQNRRVDRQLRGRAGRQGAFGASKVLVSAQEDPVAFSRQAPMLNRYASIAVGTDRPSNRKVGRLLRELQADAAADSRAAHELSRDYSMVLETQTLSYYRARQRVLTDPAWSETSGGMARNWAEHTVSRWFSELPRIGYLPLFEGLVGQLWSDLGIDCGALFGAGEAALSNALTDLLVARLAEVRAATGDATFDDSSRKVLVRTADQLWPGHLSHLRDVALSTAIAGPTHRMSAALFARLARDAYRELVASAWDQALPKILTLHREGEDLPTAQEQTPVSEEILSMLAW